VALFSILCAFLLTPPIALFSWLPILCYAWNRGAEGMDHTTMRAMFIISPVIWMIISWHGGNYTLIPVDFLGFVLGVQWAIKTAKSSILQYEEPDYE
jgi:hypothetical protein